MASDFGLRIGVEGERDFRAALQNINQAFKVLGSEMQLVTSQFDKNDKSISALTSRNTVLNKEIEAQRDKVSTLRSALDNAAASFGESDKRTQNWQIQLNKAQAELNGMERELRDNDAALAAFAKESKAAGDAQGDVADGTKRAHASFADLGGLLKGNVTQSITDVKTGIADTAHRVVDGAKDMGTSIVQFAKDTVSGENNVRALGDALRDRLEARLRGASDEMDDTADAADDMGGEIKEAGDEADKSSGKFEKLGGVLKGAGAALGAVAAAAGAAAIKLGREVVRQFGELEQNLGGSEAVFGKYASNIQKIGEDAYKNMGVSQSQYLATANKMGALFQGSGVEQQKSLDLTTKAMQRAADMASVMGIDMQVALDSVAGAAKGNFTMMDNLGVAMNATNIEAYALSKGLDFTWKTATQAEKAEMAMQMFFENTEQYAGNFARESTETISGSLGLLQAAVGSFTAGLGNADADMQNLTENVVDAFQAVVHNIVPVLNNVVAALPTAAGAILSAVGGLLPTLIETVTGLFTQVLNTILTLLPDLIPAAVQALMTIVRALGSTITAALKSVLGISSPSAVFRDQIGANLAFGLGEGFTTAMRRVTRDMQNAVPTDFDHLRWSSDASLHPITGGAGGGGGFGGGFHLTLNIENFNNNTLQDLRQLADELSTLMADGIRRKGAATA